MPSLVDAFQSMPIIAILRGVTTAEVEDIAEALTQAGIGIVEVPLNSPVPTASIQRLVKAFNKDLVVGAGTVLNSDQVRQVADAGGKFCVSPDTNTSVIKSALAANILPIPGYQTPTEAFQAIDAGATWLKCFPANIVSPEGIKSHRDVIPSDIHLLAVGGVNLSNIGDYLSAGCNGIAVAGALYKPGRTAIEVKAIAADMVAAVNEFRG